MPGLVFEVNDKDGVSVRLTTNRWEMHIAVRQPEVTAHLEAIKKVIESPAIITQDEGKAYHLPNLGAVGGKWINLYLEVVVRYPENATFNFGDVLTAFFNDRPPKGVLKWLQKK